MKLALSSMISNIDRFSSESLGVSVLELMDRSAEAVAKTVREKVLPNSDVVILAGKGNNGGDAYAAACKLIDEYNVIIYDVFGEGQKSEAGRHYLNRFCEMGGKVEQYQPTSEVTDRIKSSSCIIDAVFGTGFQGEMPELVRPLAIAVRETVGAYKIAIDVPLGINADNGSVSDFAISVNATVELSYIKPGIVSYPARAYVGEIIYDDLSLPSKKLEENFDFRYYTTDEEWVNESLPKRDNNSNKGSFGKLLMITGSEKYRGAAYLSLSAALRGGVGLVTFLGEKALTDSLMATYPEAIYKSFDEISTDTNEYDIVTAAKNHRAVLIGSGSGNTETVKALTLSLLDSEGCPVILDADAINALANMGAKGVLAIKNAKRKVILTPHPLEFARLSGTDVASVQLHRLEAAEKFAKENKCILVLKGAGTVITDGTRVFINTFGSSALSKAGSGDVLAGLLASLVAMGGADELTLSAIAVYYHSVAADALAKSFSTYGVTPSDLPLEIARQIAKTQKA